MTRWTAAAMAVWLGLVALWAIFIFGGQVQMCLGLHQTPEICRAANGLPPLTDWDRFLMGPAPPIVVTLIGWIAIALVAKRWRRQRGGL